MYKKININDNNYWGEIRKIILDRDLYLCQECKIDLKFKEAHIHHVIPRASGGSDDLANLITLCPACHSVKHPMLQVSLSRRYIERWSWWLANKFDKNLPKDITNGEVIGAALRLFNLESFRDIQLEIILTALSGKSLLFVSPTGSGKSICFQIPAILKRKITFVFVPLKTLMIDQVSNLQKRKIPSTFINSDLSRDEKEKRFDLIEKNAIRLLYLAPEILDYDKANKKNIDRLLSIKPNFLVIDEAHCVDKWGNDFRPSYSKFSEIRKMLGNPPVLAFTATASKSTQSRILESIGIEDASIFLRNVNRPSIAIARQFIDHDFDKINAIYKLISARKSGKIIIFVPTIKIGQMLQKSLEKKNLLVPFFNSKISSVEKSKIFESFMDINKPFNDTIICTNAFGMGVDVSNVRLVIHWQHPSNIEDYVQEFGRAARDGLQSVALLFVSKKDKYLNQDMIKFTIKNAMFNGTLKENSDLVRQIKIDELNVMSNFSFLKNKCLRNFLLNEFGYSSSFFKRKFSEWLLRLIFGGSEKRLKYQFCCSECARRDPMWYGKYFSEIDWVMEILKWKGER